MPDCCSARLDRLQKPRVGTSIHSILFSFRMDEMNRRDWAERELEAGAGCFHHKERASGDSLWSRSKASAFCAQLEWQNQGITRTSTPLTIPSTSDLRYPSNEGSSVQASMTSGYKNENASAIGFEQSSSGSPCRYRAGRITDCIDLDFILLS
jgi:hypothetical protein